MERTRYEQLHIEMKLIANEISLLYKKQDELKKQLQEVCPHKNKLSVDVLDYSSMPPVFEYCLDCRKQYI